MTLKSGRFCLWTGRRAVEANGCLSRPNYKALKIPSYLSLIVILLLDGLCRS